MVRLARVGRVWSHRGGRCLTLHLHTNATARYPRRIEGAWIGTRRRRSPKECGPSRLWTPGASRATRGCRSAGSAPQLDCGQLSHRTPVTEDEARSAVSHHVESRESPRGNPLAIPRGCGNPELSGSLVGRRGGKLTGRGVPPGQGGDVASGDPRPAPTVPGRRRTRPRASPGNRLPRSDRRRNCYRRTPRRAPRTSRGSSARRGRRSR